MFVCCNCEKAVLELDTFLMKSISLEQLEDIEALIPSHWLPAAVGTPQEAARRLKDQFDAGADGVILHASTAEELAPLLEAYADIRDDHRFAHYSNRPA